MVICGAGLQRNWAWAEAFVLLRENGSQNAIKGYGPWEDARGRPHVGPPIIRPGGTWSTPRGIDRVAALAVSRGALNAAEPFLDVRLDVGAIALVGSWCIMAAVGISVAVRRGYFKRRPARLGQATSDSGSSTPAHASLSKANSYEPGPVVGSCRAAQKYFGACWPERIHFLTVISRSEIVRDGLIPLAIVFCLVLAARKIETALNYSPQRPPRFTRQAFGGAASGDLALPLGRVAKRCLGDPTPGRRI